MAKTEPTVPAQEVQAAAQDARAIQENALRKRKRRRIRALRSFLIKLAALAAVIYILFFHIDNCIRE